MSSPLTRPPARKSSATFVPPDFAFAAVAQRLLESTLGLVAGDRMVLVTDASHRPLAATLADSAAIAGIELVTFVLEELCARPCAALPPAALDALVGARASAMLIRFERDELKMRSDFVDRAGRAGLRHAHIVGVRRQTLISGLAVDPRRLASVSRALLARIRPTSVLRVRSAAGSDLTITCSPQCRWLDYNGLIAPGHRANLPAGELVTSPLEVEGAYVADGSLGDSDASLAVTLGRSPIVLRITSGRVQSVACRDASLARRVEARMREGANVGRVGMVGFGTNSGITEPVGDIFADQKLPGFHISLGFPFPESTGAKWDAKGWIALTSLGADVDVDGVAVMRAGRYLLA